MSKLNSEFNYRYQVIGETVWEKIKTLQGFMAGRQRAAALEKVHELRTKSMRSKLEHLKNNGAPEYEILNLEAELIEVEAVEEDTLKNFADNRDEIKILEKLFTELYALAEPTRLKHPDGTPYSDEEMFEVNAANEFTVWMAREMQAEIIATGRPSAAKIKNAMSNPITWRALQHIGIIDPGTKYIAGSVDPTLVELVPVDAPKLTFSQEELTAALSDASKEQQIQRKQVSFE